jgi:hypothetical protein
MGENMEKPHWLPLRGFTGDYNVLSSPTGRPGTVPCNAKVVRLYEQSLPPSIHPC